jgi:hypothetical protein
MLEKSPYEKPHVQKEGQLKDISAGGTIKT